MPPAENEKEAQGVLRSTDASRRAHARSLALDQSRLYRQPVEGADSLQRALDRKRAGQTLNLTIYRGGRTSRVSIKLGEAPQRL